MWRERQIGSGSWRQGRAFIWSIAAPGTPSRCCSSMAGAYRAPPSASSSIGWPSTTGSIAPDLPGFGRSRAAAASRSPTRPTPMFWPAFWPTSASSGAHVAGLSMGGGIALSFAARHPQRVRALVLMAPTGCPDVSLARLACNRVSEFAEQAAEPGAQPWQGRGSRGRSLANLLAHPASLIATVRMVASCSILEADAARIEAPTLLLWGDRDRTIPPRLAPQFADRLPGATLRVMADTLPRDGDDAARGHRRDHPRRSSAARRRERASAERRARATPAAPRPLPRTAGWAGTGHGRCPAAARRWAAAAASSTPSALPMMPASAAPTAMPGHLQGRDRCGRPVAFAGPGAGHDALAEERPADAVARSDHRRGDHDPAAVVRRAGSGPARRGRRRSARARRPGRGPSSAGPACAIAIAARLQQSASQAST